MARKRFFRPGVVGKSTDPKVEMGELLAQPRRFVTRPGYKDVLPKQQSPFSTLPAESPGAAATSRPPVEDVSQLPLEEVERLISRPSLPGLGGVLPYAGKVDTREIVPDQLIIRNVWIDNARIWRIDKSITNRNGILIANKSDVVIWFNTTSTVSAAVGVPLAASNPAGGYNGEIFAADVDDTIEFWAIAGAGAGPHMLVVMETAKKPIG